MTCRELIEALLRAKNQEAEVRITDQVDSFNLAIFTVEGGGADESEPGDEDDVLVVVEVAPRL